MCSGSSLGFVPKPQSLHPLTLVWWQFAGSLRRTWAIVSGWAGQAVLGLVPQGDVASAVPAELGATPTDQTVFVQLLARQLQLAELTAQQTLHTLTRLGDRDRVTLINVSQDWIELLLQIWHQPASVALLEAFPPPTRMKLWVKHLHILTCSP